MAVVADTLAAMAALPFAPLETILPPGPALILAPHPDDETLGCGGLIAEACAQGRDIHVMIVTDGSFSHPGSRSWPPSRLAAQRQIEATDAVATLGLPRDRIAFLGVQDGSAPHDGVAFEAAIDRIAEHASQRGARTLLATWEHDPHADHLAVARMATSAAPRIGASLRSYPVWGWTLPPDATLPDEAVRGWRLDTSAHLDAKRRAIAAHVTQTTKLIDDDPDGFILADDFVALFTRPFEVYLER